MNVLYLYIPITVVEIDVAQLRVLLLHDWGWVFNLIEKDEPHLSIIRDLHYHGRACAIKDLRWKSDGIVIHREDSVRHWFDVGVPEPFQVAQFSAQQAAASNGS